MGKTSSKALADAAVQVPKDMRGATWPEMAREVGRRLPRDTGALWSSVEAPPPDRPEEVFAHPTCGQCNTGMTPAERMLGPACGACCRKNQRAAVRRR